MEGPDVAGAADEDGTMLRPRDTGDHGGLPESGGEEHAGEHDRWDGQQGPQCRDRPIDASGQAGHTAGEDDTASRTALRRDRPPEPRVRTAMQLQPPRT